MGAWYWLNSVPPTQWKSDLQEMKAGGISYVVAAFGYDTTAFVRRAHDMRTFLDEADEAGLGVYLNIWGPSASQLPVPAGMETVDELGVVRITPNLFERTWVDRIWVPYLETLAEAAKGHRNFLGYYFDETFQMGRPKIAGLREGRFSSYSELDRIRFRVWLMKKYGDLPALAKAWREKPASDWNEVAPPAEPSNPKKWWDWIEARKAWLRDWAQATRAAIRREDPNPAHLLVLEDDELILETEGVTGAAAAKVRAQLGASALANMLDQRGLDIRDLARFFDAISVYAAFSWSGEQDLREYQDQTRRIVRKLKTLFGEQPFPIFTFWVGTSLDSPRQSHPTVDEILSIIDIARREGARAADLYAYRVGDWRLSPVDRPDLLPGNGRYYPIAPPMKGIYLADRPQVLKALKKALVGRGLKNPADR
ncbi:MAG TPA: beta-galactosidase [Bdellovibrionota bacterium]|nr:beta-galactosidase [Bdellovibrionota bacterium]